MNGKTKGKVMWDNSNSHHNINNNYSGSLDIQLNGDDLTILSRVSRKGLTPLVRVAKEERCLSGLRVMGALMNRRNRRRSYNHTGHLAPGG